MNTKINTSKDIPGYSGDMFYVGIQVRIIYEKIKNKIKNLLSK